MKRIPVQLTYLVALLLLILAVRFDLTAWQLGRGFDAYQRGYLDGAFSAWSSAGNRQEAVYNRAVVLARKGQGDRAAQLFVQTAASTDPAIRQRSLYNHGTLLLQQGMGTVASDREKARESFSLADKQLSAAITLNPRDSDAQHNAAVARDSLAQVNALISAKREDKKKAPEKPETAKNGAEKGTQTDKPGKAGAETDSGEGKGKARSAPELSRSDAERLLNNARGRETLRSATAARKKPDAVSPPEKDW